MKKYLSAIKIKHLLLLGVFLFYLFIASNVPYTLDDWDWGLDGGIKSFLAADQNSRYAGNLLILILSRSPLLKNLVMAATFTLIPCMVLQLSDVKKTGDFVFMFILTNVLILIMDVTIWRQTYGWVSGFANFVASLPFFLGHCMILKKYLLCPENGSNIQAQPIHMILIFLFSFVGQLFIENFAVYFAAIYFFANALYFIKERRIQKHLGIAFVGVCAGIAVMFSSGLYQTLLSTGTAYSGYRELTVDTNSGISGMIVSVIKNFLYQSAVVATVDFTPQTVLILICTTILLLRANPWFARLLALANIGMGIVVAAVWGVGVFIPYRYKIAFALAYYLIILIECLYIFKGNRAKQMTAVFMWLSVYGVVLPLAVTNFAGNRLLLAPYIISVLFILILIVEVLRKIHAHYTQIHKIIAVCICVAFALVTLQYTQVYFSIGNTNRTRAEAMQTAVEQQTGVVYLERFEYQEYVWQDIVCENEEIKENWKTVYKEFFGIPHDYELYPLD